MVGSHHPLVRPHAVPGVLGNTGVMTKIGGRPHRRATKTISLLSWNGEGESVRGGRCVLAAQSGRRDPWIWAEHPPIAQWY